MNIRFLLRLAIPVAAFSILASSGADAQYQRTVLLEEVTSVTCGPCAIAGRNLNEILAAYGNQTVSVRYHVNFIPIPKDPFHEANAPENDARRAYYNATTMPVIRVDGALNPPAADKAEVVARIDAQLAEGSPLQMTVVQTGEGDSRQVHVTVTAGPDGLEAGHVLRIVAVERYLHDETFASSPYNGEVDIYDIMRDFMPTADGQAIELGPNESKIFSAAYTVGTGWQADQMYTVAFVQDEFGEHPVVQAGFSPRPTAGIRPTTGAYGSSILGSAPNPASTHAVVEFTLARPGDVRLMLRDVTGRIVKTVDGGDRAEGAGRMVVDVADLATGVYTYTLQSAAFSGSGQVVVVR